MYKAFKGTYVVCNLEGRTIKDFIRIVNKKEDILDNYICNYTLNSVMTDIFIQKDLGYYPHTFFYQS